MLRGVFAADDASLIGLDAGALDLLAIPIFQDDRVCEYIVLIGEFDEGVDEARLNMAVENLDLMVQALKHIRPDSSTSYRHRLSPADPRK